MRISYDKKADSMSIYFQDGAYDISTELASGVVLDKDKKGRLLSLEILNASKRFSRNALTELLKVNSAGRAK